MHVLGTKQVAHDGLTCSCAQEDYLSFLAFFRGVNLDFFKKLKHRVLAHAGGAGRTGAQPCSRGLSFFALGFQGSILGGVICVFISIEAQGSCACRWARTG